MMKMPPIVITAAVVAFRREFETCQDALRIIEDQLERIEDALRSLENLMWELQEELERKADNERNP